MDERLCSVVLLHISGFSRETQPIGWIYGYFCSSVRRRYIYLSSYQLPIIYWKWFILSNKWLLASPNSAEYASKLETHGRVYTAAHFWRQSSDQIPSSSWGRWDVNIFSFNVFNWLDEWNINIHSHYEIHLFTQSLLIWLEKKK